MPKILIIDDEPDVLRFQQSYLKRRKYDVVTASNTPQALEAVKNNSPDLALCDMRLEKDTSGLDIIEQAKKIKPDLIIYVVTGLLDKEIEAKATALGAKEVLHKPLTNEELEKKIKEALHSSS